MSRKVRAGKRGEEAKRGLQGMMDVTHVKRQSPNILV